MSFGLFLDFGVCCKLQGQDIWWFTKVFFLIFSCSKFFRPLGRDLDLTLIQFCGTVDSKDYITQAAMLLTLDSLFLEEFGIKRLCDRKMSMIVE